MKLQNLKSLTWALLVGMTAASCSNGSGEEPTITYALTVSATEGGTATSAKTTYMAEEEVNVTATVNDGYLFAGWYEANVMVSAEAAYTFVMPMKAVALQARFEEYDFPIAEAIDLGLSVRWASWNVGASVPEEYGGLYGWADPTGEKMTTEFNDYPSETPPANISGTEYDIAHVQWGDNWRLPTQAEVQELVENCTWEWTEANGINGRRATGPNGNSVFFPAAASRTGEDMSNQVGQRGCYWTSTLYPEDTRFAYYFYFYSGNQYSTYRTRRYFGYSVRPVTE